MNLIAGLVAILSLLGFLSPYWFGFSFLEHPRPQYCLILAIAVLLNLLGRSRSGWAWALLWTMLFLVNFALISPVMFGAAANAASSPNALRLLHVTLDHDNPDLGRAVQFANTQKADLVSLLEVTPEALPKLEAELTNYRLIQAEPRTNSHGSAWFIARQPSHPLQVMGSEVIRLPADSVRPILKTTIGDGDKVLELLCFHVIRPRNAATIAYQQVEFRAMAEWSQNMLQQGKHPIAIGDFNSTPWSFLFRQLLADSGLKNSQNGFGLQPTWHSSLPKFLQIPIDHCLHSPSFFTRDRRIGSNIGSDHLPVFVELQL
ncbi:MAG: endonuclease/exonuclease/phosphatase family protein [Leptolyngbyaceae cyanobacterium bins.302]|nr:endonuclease/exonuclease/phosphatase family protein [Leptolyngbyaceae cyanobacterium bins.302]